MADERIDQNAPMLAGHKVKKWLTVCLAEDDSFHIIGDTGTPTWSLILARHLLDQIAASIAREQAAAPRVAVPGSFVGRPPRTS